MSLHSIRICAGLALVVLFATSVRAQPGLPQILPAQTVAPLQGALPDGFENVRFYPDGVPQPAGDVNGDGRADILYTAESVADPRTEDLGDVSGQSLLFYGPASNAMFDQLVYAALRPIGDVDGDGYSDAYSQDENGHVLLHRGSPSGYGAAAVLQVEGAPIVLDGLRTQSRGFADLDGDGRADLVVQSTASSLESEGRFVVLYGAGDSLLVRAPLSDELVAGGATGANYSRGFSLVDLRGDGRDEILFSERTSTDIVVRAVSVTPQREASTRTLARLTPDASYQSGTVAAWDVDGDEDLDLILTSVFEGVRPVFYLQESSGFDPVPWESSFPVRFAGDLNGDGAPDAIAPVQDLSGTNRSVQLHLGPAIRDESSRTLLWSSDGVPISTPPVTSALTSNQLVRRYGDLDGDGDDDVVIALEVETLDGPRTGFGRAIVAGVADRSEAEVVIYDGSTFPSMRVRLTASLGDVNGDGIDDLGVVQARTKYRGSERIEVYYGGAALLDEPSVTLGAPLSTPPLTLTDLASVDFDGEGSRDIVATFFSDAAGLSTNAVVWLSSDGGVNGTEGWIYFCQFSECLQRGQSRGLYNIGIADVDGDGVEDVVTGGARPIVLRGGERPSENGFAAFPAERVVRDPVADDNGRSERIVGAGDLNDDGVDDVVWCDLSRCVVALGSPSALFASATLDLIPPGSASFPGISIAAGDFDGDDKSDIAVVVGGSGEAPPAANVYFGGAGFDASADVVIDLSPFLKPDQRLFTAELTSVPDLDGDGDDELLLGGDANSLVPARATLLAGGTFEPLVELVAPNASTPLGASNNSILSSTRSAVGDFDGDGTPDVLLPQTGDSNDAPESSRLYLFSLDLDAAIVSGEPGPSRVGSIAVGPNPARDVLRIQADAPRATSVRVWLFDALGREVARLDREVAAGVERIELETGRLAPGVYVLRVTMAGEHHTRTVTVAR